MSQATKAARDAKRREIGEVVSGPFEVGNIGTVQVVKRQAGAESHLYAAFLPVSGRPQRIPLAAVAILAESLE